MIIRVIDFETTGMPPDAAICEVGWHDVRLGAEPPPLFTYEASVCNPGRPMPPEARAIHHISDRELADAPAPDRILMQMAQNVDVFCAHNAAFERQFFTGGDRPWICTLKVARRLWPDCPSHTNQCLRYWLGLDVDEIAAMPPHRAGPDAYVTGNILRKALGLATVEQMVEWTSQPSLLPRITFGKHRGLTWGQTPVDYLQWITRQADMDPDVKFTASHWLKSISDRR